MAWTVWILASAVFLSLYDLAKKASVRENAVLPVLLCSTSFGAAAFLLGLAFSGQFATAWAGVGPLTIGYGAIKAAVVAISWIFTFTALRSLPISIATPIRASAPALVFVIAFFAYGEIPSLLQGMGMLAVFAGYFVFSWAGRHEGIDFFRNRAVWCAVAGAFFSAMSSLLDKYVFQVAKAPIETVQLLFQVSLIVFYGLALLASRLLPAKLATGRRFAWRRSIPCVGVLLAAADWLYFHGLSLPEVPISVCALLRRFSVVITFVIGARFFKETNLRRKALALAVILLGVLLICAA